MALEQNLLRTLWNTFHVCALYNSYIQNHFYHSLYQNWYNPGFVHKWHDTKIIGLRMVPGYLCGYTIFESKAISTLISFKQQMKALTYSRNTSPRLQRAKNNLQWFYVWRSHFVNSDQVSRVTSTSSLAAAAAAAWDKKVSVWQVWLSLAAAATMCVIFSQTKAC